MQFDDVRMVDALDDDYLFGDHFALLLGHGLDLDHLDGEALDLALFPALEDLAGRPRADLAHQAIVSHLFESLRHKNITGLASWFVVRDIQIAG